MLLAMVSTMTVSAENPNIARTREFLSALEALDIPRFMKSWADDGVQEQPYAPAPMARKLEGKAAIAKQYGGAASAFKSMRFPVKRIVASDNVVTAEFDGSVELKAGGRYDNHYVGIFEWSKDGKLKRYTEYFDPTILANGFPGMDAALATDAQRIQDRIASVAALADGRDWAKLRTVFADQVDVDYTSVGGGKPAVISADALVAGWKEGLTHYRQTKHNFSSFDVKVSGDTAIANFTGQATHVKDDKARWSCGGDYVFKLKRSGDGWLITAARFDMKWEQGAR